MENHKEMMKINIIRCFVCVLSFGLSANIQAINTCPIDSLSNNLSLSEVKLTKKTPTLSLLDDDSTKKAGELLELTSSNDFVLVNPTSTPKYSVGTSEGVVTVGNSGAAVYTMKIKAPNGGSLTPQIALSYNSQSNGYGLAGYGFNISGISSITRGGHDLFHDGKQAGITYSTSDNFYLDGKRLILQSGSSGLNGAVYTIEGDPFTKIVLHGNNDNSTTAVWFEVTTNTGMTYQYGNSLNSKIVFRNKKGYTHVDSWYINKATDKYSNYIIYEYAVNNLCIRPTSIIYGMNSAKSRGISNKINFLYQSLGGNARSFAIEDQQGKIDMCLSSIVTTSNSAVYRTYKFTYDDNSDQSNGKWTRLVQVDEENGNGDKFAPVKFTWQYLPSPDVHSSQLDVPTKDGSSFVEETSKQFLSADLNGDGVSDIIRVSPVKVTTAIGPGYKSWDYYTYVYVSRSELSVSGKVTYKSPMLYTLPAGISMDVIKSMFGGSSVMDFDGDGYNDLVFPFQNTATGYWNQAAFYVIMGSDVAAGRSGNIRVFAVYLQSTDRAPLFATFDIDGNGKDDVVCVEQRKKDNYYPCTIVQLAEGNSLNRTELRLTLPQGVNKDINKIFVGDYNNDGLSDFILLYDGGYKIYFNNGGNTVASRFTENNAISGTDFGNYWRIQQGDFDGDGLSDFVYNKSGESVLWIAHNNGNGTFTHTRSVDIGVADHASNKDDSRFTLMTYDIDHDGRSDVMVCKAGYVHRGFPRFRNDFTNTQVRWIYSTGSNLKLGNSFTKNREDDANESSFFIGDFDGDGYPELANYGSLMNSSDNTFNEKINLYKAGTDLAQMGKITRVTDGMGCNTDIQYAVTTSPSVYKKSINSAYPVNTYTLHLSVVYTLKKHIGFFRWQTNRYFYEDLRLHIAGKGMLGFNTVTTEHLELGTKDVTSVTQWDNNLWIPTETKTLNYVGSSSSTIVSTYSSAKIGNNYFSYISRKDITDLDGNAATTISNYDVSKGVLVDEIVKNDGDNMYKKVAYSDYQLKAGTWLPMTMTISQKHTDDPVPYTTVTTYNYDDKGDVLTSTVNSGTNMALTTVRTYDTYGNILSSVTTGNGVKPVTKYNNYDPSGRFVIKSYTNPASALNTFTYDLWGNILTENDETDPSNILTTRHSYDGWGRKSSTIQADGTQKIYEINWMSEFVYYVKESVSGKPTITTWYDKFGNETKQESFGANGMPVTKVPFYNMKGQVSQIINNIGNLQIKEFITYDERGRILTDVLSTGKSITYSYGNRSVTKTSAGRSFTTTSDAWGNIIKSTDPVTEVKYEYYSIGKPSRVTTQGSTVAMTYDAAGNQLSLTDPDAGISTYTYAADGTLLTETDGRGIKTTNYYDNLGRLSSKQIGSKTIAYTYGTAGYDNLRLKRQVFDNNSIEYTYDRFGRIVTENRNIDGHGIYQFSYTYNSNNQLAKTTYPGGLEETYLYDDNGFKIQSSVGDKIIYKVESTDGIVTSTSFLGKLTATQTKDARGYEINCQISKGSSILENFDESYDGATDNLLSRNRNNNSQETFNYDNLDRIVSVTNGDRETMKMSYSPNGNILFKTGVGNFTYNQETRPHAVTEVENIDGKIPSDVLTTTFNDFGKIQQIEDAGRNLRMDFSYGPDQQRWFSELSDKGKSVRTTIYAGEYEKITENGITREFYYLDGNTIAIRENDEVKYYMAFTDNLGSILSVMDEEGVKVFDAAYDVWGHQTISVNAIGLHRGYTGHEMLNEFDIINMNGRLYDPVLGRFFSPDNYVQMPDNSQNFNRYSYCLNNPLKYTDPSGELAWFVPVIAGAIIGAYTGASIQSGTAAFWNWKPDAWKGAIVGGIVGATIGYGISSVLASSGGVTGLTTSFNGVNLLTKPAGITSSILSSGSINIAFNTISGGNWDSAWKAGVAGLATGAWSVTGGFGMVKGFGATSRFGKLAGKLGFQMIGTVSQSIGNNWASNKGIFSNITLGVGPINLTIGKGQRLLQFGNNIGNTVFNTLGIANLFLGGKMRFDWENLSPVYYGGMRDKLFGKESAFGSHAIFGDMDIFEDRVTFTHEMHHLWQSRAMIDSFLPNYAIQGIFAVAAGGSFIEEGNYLEQLSYFHYWFK